MIHPEAHFLPSPQELSSQDITTSLHMSHLVEAGAAVVFAVGAMTGTLGELGNAPEYLIGGGVASSVGAIVFESARHYGKTLIDEVQNRGYRLLNIPSSNDTLEAK